MLGKIPSSVQNAITLAQKKDTELCMIQGLHNHDPKHKINYISSIKQYHSKSSGPRPCHGCNGPHLIRDCENSVCKKCKLNADNHVPARCPNRKPPAKQQQLTDQYDTSPHINWSNGHNYTALQLSVSTSQPNHVSELLEATRKMTRYFKKSYKSRSYQNNGNNNH